jgi:predicted Zn-dependent protease
MFNHDECHALAELALELIDKGRHEEAGVIIRGLVDHRPDWAWGWYAAGRHALKQGHVVDAVRLLEIAVQRGASQARLPLVEALWLAGDRVRAQQLGAAFNAECTDAEQQRLRALGVLGR